MEKYRNTLKLRIYLLSVFVFATIGFGIFDAFYASESVKSSIIFDFQCGLTLALGVIALVSILRYRKILKNETYLKIQYNKEFDERLKTIRAKAGVPMSLISSILMIIAGIIIGYRNITVFYTLILTAMCQLIAACMIKLVYSKLL